MGGSTTPQLQCLRLECGPSGNTGRDDRYCNVVPLNLYLHIYIYTNQPIVNIHIEKQIIYLTHLYF